MAYNKKTWKARQGLGLNKFSIDGATPVPVINQPDSVTQQGDALSAGNLNDLEQRIADAFDDVEGSEDVLQSQINQHESRLKNLEQKAGDYGVWHYPNDPNHSSDMPNAVPTGKAKYGLVKSFVGKTRAWNQLCPAYNDTYSDSGISFSGDGTGEITVVVNNPTNYAQVYIGNIALIGGHKYAVVGGDRQAGFEFYMSGYPSQDGDYIITAGNSSSSIMYLFVKATTPNGTYKLHLLVRDLTLIFGSGNEPSTVADALAQLPALGQYNAYDAGSLVDTEVSGVKSVGVNIWDEEWEVGRYDSSTGQKSASTTNIRNKNFIKVFPNTSYYLKASAVATVLYYDANMNFISLTYAQNEAITTPSNACYINFFLASGYGTTYNHDIQICLNSYADKTTYHPYKTDTLSLPSPVTLRSAGSVADTDELNVEVLVDGVKVNKRRQTTRVGVEVVAEGRGFSANGQCYQSLVKISGADESQYWGAAGPIISPKIPRAAMSDMYAGTVTNGISMNEGRIIIGKDTYANRATLLDGTTLNFALATPTVTLLDPVIDNFIEVEGGGTIDTIQEQTPVIDNCLDVGYLTV